jgi:flagellar hook-associated protein 2
MTSGLDIDALVSATIQADSLPMISLQNKNTTLQSRMNGYNNVKTSMFLLQSATKDLTYQSTFLARKATSSNENVVTAVSQNNSVSGTYAIHVGQMATATHNTSAPLGGSYASLTGSDISSSDVDTAFTDSSVLGGSVHAGSFTINGQAISVADSDTINTVVQKINASNAGVTAAVSGGKLVLTQKTGGSASTITLGATDTSNFLNATGLAAATVQAGTNSTMGSGTYTTLTGTSLTAIDSSRPNDQLGISGSINVNGNAIAIGTTDTLNTILNKISASSAGVNATLSGNNVVLTQKTIGSSATIAVGGDSGLLSKLGLTTSPVAGVNPDQARPLNQVSALSGISKGYFSINGTFISVDPSTDTLNSIISRINNSGAGVLAFYDASTQKITLNSKQLGDGDITLGTSSTDSSDFLEKVGLVQANQVKGQNASVTVNGTQVTATGNTVNLGDGNTFTLVGAGDATVSVGTDIDKIVDKVKAFITQYNTTIDLVNGYMNDAPDSSSNKAAGDLFGDSTLRNISYSLRDFASTTVQSQSSSMQMLYQAGISDGSLGQSVSDTSSGHWTLDEDKLRAALQKDPSVVASLFGNSLATSEANVDADGDGIKDGELVGTGDNSTKTFQLSQKWVTQPEVWVNGIKYTQVSGTPRANGTGTDQQYNEYSLDYVTGKITFGTAPATGDKIVASFTYDADTGSKAGVFVQMGYYLNGITQVGGTIDSLTGSEGAITKQIQYNTDRISEMQDRLNQEQSRLYDIYNQMETTLNNLKSQSTWLTSQLAGLPSWSSSK